MAVLFGSPSAPSEAVSVATPTLEIRDNEKRSMPIKWNQTAESLVVPAMPTKYAANDYDAGTLQTSDFVPGITEVGAEGVSAVFIYSPAAGVKKMPVTVTYQLTVEKADALPLALVSDARQLTYGDTPEKIAFDDMVSKQGNEAYQADKNAEPVLTDGTGTVITAADTRLMPVASTVTATYKAALDEKHYHGAPEALYTIAYTVVSKALPQTESKPEDQNLLIGAGFTMPDAKPAEEHYALKSDLPVTKVTDRTDTAKNAPPVGGAIDADQVDTYEKGTKFTVTYTYTVADGNFTGPDYTVVYNYTVGNVQAVKPSNQATQLPAVHFSYGQSSLSSPPDAPVLGSGYVGSYATTVVTAKSGVAGTNSPAIGAAVNWGKINDYNAGTEFDVTYAYTAGESYKGDAFTATRHYVIDKLAVAIPEDVSSAASLTYGTVAADIVAPNLPTESYFARPTVAYYKDISGIKTPIAASAVKDIAAGQAFSAEWTYLLIGDNHKPASGTKSSYRNVITYTVQKAATSYASTKTVYDPLTRIYKQGLEDTVPNALPDAVQGATYVLKSTTYKITRKSSDGKTPAGAIAGLTTSATYGAGTIVAATYVFTPDSNHTGADVIATGTIEVVKKPGVKPTAEELVGTNNDKTYGEEQIQPVYAGTFEGWTQGKSSGKVTARGSGNPAVNTSVTWANFKTYSPGTVITVSYPFTADTNNYANITGQINYTQTMTVVRRSPVLPTTNELQLLQTVNYEYKTDVKKPAAPAFPGKGYINGVLASAVVSKQSSINDKDSPVIGTNINWADFKTYNSGTEITVTFTYQLDSATYASTDLEYGLVQKYVVVKAGAVPVYWDPWSKIPTSTYKQGTLFKIEPPPPPKGTVGYGLGWVYYTESNYDLRTKEWKINSWAGMDWDTTDKYPAGAFIEVRFQYSYLPNYEDRTYRIASVRDVQQIKVVA